MAEQETGEAAKAEQDLRSEAARTLTPEAKTSILAKLASGVASLGTGAVKLLNAIRGVKDPEEAIRAFDAQLEANRARRVPLTAHHDQLFSAIAAKKKIYEKAPVARRSLLEMELRAMISEFKSEERQLKIYLENEVTISAVRGRTLELMARGLQTIKAGEIDILTDRIEQSAAGAEDLSMSLRDLESAGRCRESSGVHESFMDDLAAFDEEAPSMSVSEMSAPTTPGASGSVPPTMSAATPQSAVVEPLDLSGF